MKQARQLLGVRGVYPIFGSPDAVRAFLSSSFICFNVYEEHLSSYLNSLRGLGSSALAHN